MRVQQRSMGVLPGTESLARFAQTGATLVLHLAITRIRLIAEELTEYLGKDCPVVVVYRASQPQELLVRGNLANIATLVEDAGLRRAAVILVGPAMAKSATCAESHLYSSDRVRTVR